VRGESETFPRTRREKARENATTSSNTFTYVLNVAEAGEVLRIYIRYREAQRFMGIEVPPTFCRRVLQLTFIALLLRLKLIYFKAQCHFTLFESIDYLFHPQFLSIRALTSALRSPTFNPTKKYLTSFSTKRSLNLFATFVSFYLRKIVRILTADFSIYPSVLSFISILIRDAHILVRIHRSFLNLIKHNTMSK
jgi:hypothetical protein